MRNSRVSVGPYAEPVELSGDKGAPGDEGKIKQSSKRGLFRNANFQRAESLLLFRVNGRSP